ncbi:hypothetical protein A4X13_0g7414 [Tilletia indica]|uniref:Uncharacterized protein n=1 Tax=Tilletia indica TaxID=43049 RepID=A0A8T8SL50_9BASI|nr:hypothetical protein A4X13_0g7414 [Tilletia indica]
MTFLERSRGQRKSATACPPKKVKGKEKVAPSSALDAPVKIYKGSQKKSDDFTDVLASPPCVDQDTMQKLGQLINTTWDAVIKKGGGLQVIADHAAKSFQGGKVPGLIAPDKGDGPVCVWIYQRSIGQNDGLEYHNEISRIVQRTTMFAIAMQTLSEHLGKMRSMKTISININGCELCFSQSGGQCKKPPCPSAQARKGEIEDLPRLLSESDWTVDDHGRPSAESFSNWLKLRIQAVRNDTSGPLHINLMGTVAAHYYRHLFQPDVKPVKKIMWASSRHGDTNVHDSYHPAFFARLHPKVRQAIGVFHTARMAKNFGVERTYFCRSRSLCFQSFCRNRGRDGDVVLLIENLEGAVQNVMCHSVCGIRKIEVILLLDVSVLMKSEESGQQTKQDILVCYRSRKPQDLLPFEAFEH